MAGAVVLLLLCQLCGVLLNRLGVPVPGPVLGMGVLLIWLGLVRRERPSLEKVTGWLTAHLPIMFVPAAVGLMDEGPILKAHGLPILLATLVSTALTIIVTALVFRWSMRRMGLAGTDRITGAGQGGEG